VDAVVLSGGEPTLQDQGCEAIFKLAKYYKLETMLNTNLSQPNVIVDLIEKNLVDKIAADVKAPLNSLEYQEMTGTNDAYLNTTIGATIRLINRLEIPLELRTTCIKDSYSDGKHLLKLIDEIAPLTMEWHLQQFDDKDILDPTLKGRVVGKDKLLEYGRYAKSKGIAKVLVVTRQDGFIEL
jgi:pyruvate formate lyase activating enzyme